MWWLYQSCNKNTLIPIQGVEHTWIDANEVTYLNHECELKEDGTEEHKVKILLKNGVMRTINCKDDCGKALFILNDLAEDIKRVRAT